MDESEREKQLLDWTTEKCSDENEGGLDFEEGWSMIKRHGLDVLNEMLKIFLLNKDGSGRRERKPLGNRGWISLYTISYQMSNLTTNSGELFYARICDFITTYVKSAGVQSTIAEADLPEFVAVWQSYKLMTKWIVYLFMHLENGVIKLNELLTLTSVALAEFQKWVYDRFHPNLTALCQSLILREREGELIDGTLLQESLQIYVMMGLATMIDTAFATEKRDKLKNIDAALKVQEYTSLYLRDFEVSFLQNTRDFYQRKSSEWLGCLDVPSYVTAVMHALHQEDSRCTEYLSSVTRPKVARVVLVECVVAHADRLFDTAKEMLYAMYDNSQGDGFELPAEKTALVEHLYRLCCMCQALDPGNAKHQLATRMRGVFAQYVVEMGVKVIEDRRAEVTRLAEESKQSKAATAAGAADASVADPHTIASILRLFHYTPLIVQTVFGDDLGFKQAANEAFTSVVNKDMGKFSVMQMLAAYCDNLLKGNMKVPEAEVDRLLQSCMAVFSHLLDKDVFADLHRAYLGKRLLTKRSCSSDSEKLIVGLMKMQCGAQFTSKLEGMLNDYAFASSSQSDYDASLKAWQGRQSRELKQIAFTNTLLTASFWPTARPRAFHYPAEMAALQQHYASWFKTKHSGRNLQWIPTLGDVSLQMTVKGKSYEVTVSVLQAVVLRVFDRREGSLSFEEIKSRTGIEEDEVLKRTIHSLACQKFKVLRKLGDAKNIAVDDFCGNASFSNNLRKFRIPMPVIDDAEASAGNKFVAEERGHTVDASIVRIMKARKFLSHTDLQYEVLRQITAFQPEPKFIKQRIESLIEREYLERDTTDARCYKYMP